jgi:acyl-CoA thioesterase
MTKQERAEKIVDKMMAEDAFSRWMGIEPLQIKPGFACIRMEVRPEMNNGFNITHGGLTHSFADSALAFASNSCGRIAVALETSISYHKPVEKGDILTAETEELSLGKNIAVYNVVVTNQQNNNVATFRGTVFRTKKHHLNSSLET